MDPIRVADRLEDEFRTACIATDCNEPWFGHVALRVEGELREYRVGPLRALGERVIPASHPIARAYYEREPGEAFEIPERGKQVSKAMILHRARLNTRDGEVKSVLYTDVDREALLVRTDRGFQVRFDDVRVSRAGAGLPDVLAFLTREQHQLIASTSEQPLIIEGRAGSGKTTVALYRVAWLANAWHTPGERPVDPARVLIVMFNRALRMFVAQALPGLRLERAELDTFHGWALNRVKRAYRSELRLDSSDRPGKRRAASLKKSLGILHALEEYVERQRERVADWLDTKLAPYAASVWLDGFDASELPLVRALVEVKSAAVGARDSATGHDRQRLDQVVRVFERAVARARQYKAELLHVLTDRELLRRHLPDASRESMDAMISYQRALQGKDAPDVHRTGPWIAFEDLALLLRLIQLKNGGLPRKHDGDELDVYDHVVIDEVQDFGAVELSVLLSSVRSRTGVTIAGDLNQKIVPEAAFIGWDALVAQLGVSDARVARLTLAHRSTFAIMRAADTLVAGRTTPGPCGPVPTLTTTDTEERALDRACMLVRRALRDHPRAHVAVVARHQRDVGGLYDVVARQLAGVGTPVRIGHNDSFSFSPGVTVTNIRQVKGLEFDAVVAFDASECCYPANEQGRRNLYMVMTRARDRLDLVCVGEPTVLLREACDRGFVEVLSDAALVVPVFFGEDDHELIPF